MCVVWNEIAKIARKVVKEQSLDADGKEDRDVAKQADLREHDSWFGSTFPQRRSQVWLGVLREKDQVGIVTGLAWTQVGGELLSSRRFLPW